MIDIFTKNLFNILKNQAYCRTFLLVKCQMSIIDLTDCKFDLINQPLVPITRHPLFNTFQTDQEHKFNSMMSLKSEH